MACHSAVLYTELDERTAADITEAVAAKLEVGAPHAAQQRYQPWLGTWLCQLVAMRCGRHSTPACHRCHLLPAGGCRRHRRRLDGHTP